MAPAIASQHHYQIVLPPPDFELLDRAQVDAQLDEHRPDAILHLAAQSNVPHSFSDPEGTFRVNVFGTLHLFQGIKRSGLAPRIVLASSGDVYGQVPEPEMPITEERIPRPRSPYAVSKLAAEALCCQWHETEGLEVVVARPFNHIGSGQSDSFALPAFARQIAEIKAGKRPAHIDVGDIDVSRDFTHVADVIEGYLILLEKGKAGEIYNIASGSDCLIRTLLGRLLELAGVNAPLRRDMDRFRPSEQRVVRGGNAKIRGLGWHPTRSIDEALSDILQDWEQRIRNG